jgi:hypothetical protein
MVLKKYLQPSDIRLAGVIRDPQMPGGGKPGDLDHALDFTLQKER